MKPLHVMLATAGRPDLLARTLASLAICPRPDGFRQTIIVENGAKRGAEDVVRAADSALNCRYRFVDEGNKSVALNAGMADVGEDDALIYFIDDDVRFAACTLTAYADAAGKGASGGVFFGGPTEVDYEREPPQWLKPYLPPSARGTTPDVRPDAPMSAGFLGFNWAAFACDIAAAGGFNANHGPGSRTGGTGQEVEMQARLKARGVRPVYVPDARVWHYVPIERSSMQWMIERSYKKGIEVGLRKWRRKIELFGYPAALLARRGQYMALKAIGPILPQRARFNVQFWDSHYRGVARGVQLRHAAASAHTTTTATSGQVPAH